MFSEQAVSLFVKQKEIEVRNEVEVWRAEVH